MAQASPFRPPLAKLRRTVGHLLSQSLGTNGNNQILRSSGQPDYDRMVIVETIKTLNLVHSATYRQAHLACGSRSVLPNRPFTLLSLLPFAGPAACRGDLLCCKSS